MHAGAPWAVLLLRCCTQTFSHTWSFPAVVSLPRYMYAEGMKLAKRYEEEEGELADKLKVRCGES